MRPGVGRFADRAATRLRPTTNAAGSHAERQARRFIVAPTVRLAAGHRIHRLAATRHMNRPMLRSFMVLFRSVVRVFDAEIRLLS